MFYIIGVFMDSNNYKLSPVLEKLQNEQEKCCEDIQILEEYRELVKEGLVKKGNNLKPIGESFDCLLLGFGNVSCSFKTK